CYHKAKTKNINLIKQVLFVCCLLFTSSVIAQSPVQWKAVAKKIDKEHYQITVSAALEEGWYIYSSTASGRGLQPTRLEFDTTKGVMFLDSIAETGILTQKQDANSNSIVGCFYEKVEYIQKVKIRGNPPIKIAGSVLYMGCNQMHCLAPQLEEF